MKLGGCWLGKLDESQWWFSQGPRQWERRTVGGLERHGTWSPQHLVNGYSGGRRGRYPGDHAGFWLRCKVDGSTLHREREFRRMSRLGPGNDNVFTHHSIPCTSRLLTFAHADSVSCTLPVEIATCWNTIHPLRSISNTTPSLKSLLTLSNSCGLWCPQH